MILGFSTKINGKPTFFVEKIHSGLLQNGLMNGFDIGNDHNFDLDVLATCEPKLHTIRLDASRRWKKGNNIDFFINCRQLNMFRFAPVLPVVSVQRIFMTYDNGLEISISGNQLNNLEIEKLAINDGFDSVDDFDDYFRKRIAENEDEFFSGKIIHWTGLRY